MKGILSTTPQTLTDAIKPIASMCAKYEWAIGLQSGPFREIYLAEEDDSRNLLYLLYNIPSEWTRWFRRGILPEHAEDLVLDEWSYFLGYDPDKYNAQNIAQRLNNDISPRKELFDLVREYDCIFLMYTEDSWEAYCNDPMIHSIFLANWAGKEVESMPWELPYDPINFTSR